METTLNIIASDECDEKWSKLMNITGIITPRWMVCAHRENTDACKVSFYSEAFQNKVTKCFSRAIQVE